MLISAAAAHWRNLQGTTVSCFVQQDASAGAGAQRCGVVSFQLQSQKAKKARSAKGNFDVQTTRAGFYF